MSAQPEALRLADEYASDGWIAGTRQWCEEAAAELRRLHAANLDCSAWYGAAKAQRDELLDALKLAEAALADIGDADREPGDDLAWCEARAAQDLPAIRAAIAKAEAK